MRLVTILLAAFLLMIPTAAQARVVELGSTAAKQTASCPDNCQAIGQVTGFQVQQGAAASPFKATRRGKIVAFTMQLGQPNSQQMSFFNRLFGGKSQARLTVLKPSEKKMQLTGQSATFPLERYFGSSPTFVVNPPLTVKRDYVVALTVPTWAPAFAVNLGQDEAWRSSRDPDKCDDVRQKAAQEVRGGQRTYGCLYRTARILYSATMIPDPRQTAKPKAEEKEPAENRR
ncbi:MAG: hypothetical protein H0T15_08280 [Thermoleophilaceae bacterium]|nr:hypothetical protein [Thermoleophilaceae bacterium]